ncbi:hypothetical protein Ancab_023128 [Ancistrocladus abbreviatus]
MQAEKGLRIDIGELKAQMLKKIGPERFKRYFDCLSRFVNQKLSKIEFDRFCNRILGRENLPLHNQIIKSILKNACSARFPPPVHEVGPKKPVIAAGKSSLGVENAHGQGGLLVPNQTPAMPVWANGAVLSMSPRKVRSGIRDRKLRDRPSPLGLNGKADSASNQSTGTEDSGGKTIENGDLIPFDFQKPVQHLHGPAEQPENEERPKTKKSLKVPGLTHSKDQNNVPTMEDGDEVEQGSHLSFSRSPLLAPLGIPFCSAHVGGICKYLPATSTSNFPGSYDSGGLFDTDTLRKRMELIAAAQGLGGVSMQCANVLNNMVDVYLKQLIRSCVELVRARSTNSTRYPLQKQQIQGKLMNGLWPSNHLHIQSSFGTVEEWKNYCSISLLDFKVAMGLNPQQLGEDWPLLLEKISLQAFEE